VSSPEYYREYRASHPELREYKRQWTRDKRGTPPERYRVPEDLGLTSTCPDCGARLGSAEQEGWDDHDRYFRRRKCRNCGRIYATVELVVPGTFYAWAESFRHARARLARIKRGFKGTNIGRYVRPQPKLIIKARIIEPKAAR
jgi:hypothetical protein